SAVSRRAGLAAAAHQPLDPAVPAEHEDQCRDRTPGLPARPGRTVQARAGLGGRDRRGRLLRAHFRGPGRAAAQPALDVASAAVPRLTTLSRSVAGRVVVVTG